MAILAILVMVVMGLLARLASIPLGLTRSDLSGFLLVVMFSNGGNTFAGATVCAYNRSKMLLGQAATQQCFNTSTTYGGLLPADMTGTVQPPAGSPNYILGLGATSSSLAFWKFHVDWNTPANSTFTGPTSLSVASYSEACGITGTCIPQSGTTQQLANRVPRG